MRIPTRNRKYGLRLAVTPLIDIVFLLIIFFLAASHFITSETREPVELAETAYADEERDSPRRLVITVTHDRRLLVGSTELDIDEVKRRITAGGARHKHENARFEVRIRADRRVPYEAVQPILTACAAAGVPDVKFAVLQE